MHKAVHIQRPKRSVHFEFSRISTKVTGKRDTRGLLQSYMCAARSHEVP
jgi:hypothetical protein